MTLQLSSRPLGLALLLLSSTIFQSFGQSLRVATANIWTGLDYIGNTKVGEYESEVTREKRFRILLDELTRARPDVIALQEVNPVSRRSRALADALGYDFICQRVNSGAKVGGLGIPVNLNEGVVILARRDLHLELVDVWDLSSGPGWFGNALSFHWTDRNVALVGKIRLGKTTTYVINVHLSSAVPDDSCSRYVASQIVASGSRNEIERQALVEKCLARSGSRMRSVEILLDRLSASFQNTPIILLGDFNAFPSQAEIRRLTGEGGFIDAAGVAGFGDVATWDPDKNTNIRYSVQEVDASGSRLDPHGLLSAWYDGRARRIDYIFLKNPWQSTDVKNVHLLLDAPEGDLYASDHFGVLADLSIDSVSSRFLVDEEKIPEMVNSKVEGLPILSYDTDVGLGYGAKGFFLNYLGGKESFDALAFNSTKGERWYRLVFSMPDFELRQGKVYPISFDLTIDYDKYLKNNFFGVGSGSRVQDLEKYTKEPLQISGIVSRGFNRETVGQLGLKYQTVRNFNYEPESLFATALPDINHGTSSALTVFASIRYDSRESYINASRGQVAEIEFESGGSWLLGNYSVTRTTLALQTYHVLFYPKTVFAARLWGQMVGGTDLPVNALASVGGTGTLRGYPQDRYLDRVAGVLNAEIRFPLSWRIGGIIGLDAGKVAGSMTQFTLGKWAVNPVAGLRFYMDTFVIRADLGFGRETTGFYLNFGQLF